MLSKKDIIAEGKRLGFFDIRFAQVEMLTNEIRHYAHWISNNYQGKMSYLERNLDKKENINLVLDNAKTVIVFGYTYNTGIPHEKMRAGTGKISRYGWGDDYHDILSDKLKSICNNMKESQSNSNQRAYVDTGPILERQWAVKSGLGWQGKSGNIISKTAGSQFFIGIIISDHIFEPDLPVKNLCGTCTKCMDACPSKAIVQEKIVDSTKCLAYWTIEVKAEFDIPEDITQKNKEWLFGCDVCQDVCPWNKKTKIFTEDQRLFPRNGDTILDSDFVLGLKQEDFSLRFRKSPIKRTKLKGLQRNMYSLLK